MNVFDIGSPSVLLGDFVPVIITVLSAGMFLVRLIRELYFQNRYFMVVSVDRQINVTANFVTYRGVEEFSMNSYIVVASPVAIDPGISK